MRTITATELRQKLGEILDAASAGEPILIERDHRPLAFLVSYEDGERVLGDEDRIARQLKALDELVEMGRAWRREHPRDPDEMSSTEWIRWDRDHRDDEKYERIFGKEGRQRRAASRTERKK